MDEHQWDLETKEVVHPTLPICRSLREMQLDEVFHPINTWDIIRFPENRILDVKRTLFIILMNLLQKEPMLIKTESAKPNPRLPNLKYVSFPRELRNEIKAIFGTFTPEQRDFLRYLFF